MLLPLFVLLHISLALEIYDITPHKLDTLGGTIVSVMKSTTDAHSYQAEYVNTDLTGLAVSYTVDCANDGTAELKCTAAAGVGKDHNWRLHDTTDDTWTPFFEGQKTSYKVPQIVAFDSVASGNPGTLT